MLSVPSSASSARRPLLKSTMSGTWANTLFATTRSAGPCICATLVPVSSPRNITSVGTPRSTAEAATLAAGSMPSERMPRARLCCRR